MTSLPNTRCQASPRDIHRGTVRYLCELLIGVLLVCITLHTFILAGLIVPVTVSGGSMAETILGPRREVVCLNCGITFACGHERMPAGDRAICLNCGFRDVDLNAGWDWPGEHALVDRASLSFRPPRRWEVLVFRCPERADTYCIKRVVGLPGEAIQIIAGDVYVNGEIARKRLAECRAVAQLVHDASFAPKEINARTSPPDWRTATTNADAAWSSPSLGKFVHEFEEIPSDVPTTAKDLDWLEFRSAGDRPVTDDDSYNQSESRRLNEVTDLMLECEVTLAGLGEFIIRSEVEHDRFEVRIRPQDHSVILTRNRKHLSRSGLSNRDFSRPIRLELIRFDRQIFLTVGGVLMIQDRYDPLPQSRPPADSAIESEIPTSPAWAIGAASLDVEVQHLRVLRDIYYTVPAPGHNTWAIRRPVTLSADEFFVLGDNSPISADSRTQDQPGIARKLLVGRLLTTW